MCFCVYLFFYVLYWCLHWRLRRQWGLVCGLGLGNISALKVGGGLADRGMEEKGRGKRQVEERDRQNRH